MSTQFHFYFRVHIFDNASVELLFFEIFLCTWVRELLYYRYTEVQWDHCSNLYIKHAVLVCDITKTKIIVIKSCLAWCIDNYFENVNEDHICNNNYDYNFGTCVMCI